MRGRTGPLGGGNTGSPARAAERPPKPRPMASARITRIGDVGSEGIGAIYLIPAGGATRQAAPPVPWSSKDLRPAWVRRSGPNLGPKVSISLGPKFSISLGPKNWAQRTGPKDLGPKIWAKIRWTAGEPGATALAMPGGLCQPRPRGLRGWLNVDDLQHARNGGDGAPLGG